MYRQSLLALLGLCTLSACMGNRSGEPLELSTHDLGLPPAAAAPVLLLTRVELRPAPWLNSTAMQYRYANARETERLSYAGHRWAAPPAELLEARLARALGAGEPSRCKLSIQLDEFVQIFDPSQGSTVLLVGTLSLRGDKPEQVLAKRSVEIRKSAATATAQSGVRALREAADTLASEARSWLGSLPGAECKL